LNVEHVCTFLFWLCFDDFKPNLNDLQRKTRARFFAPKSQKKNGNNEYFRLADYIWIIMYIWQNCKTLSSENSIQRILYLIQMVKMFTHDSTRIRRRVYIIYILKTVQIYDIYLRAVGEWQTLAETKLLSVYHENSFRFTHKLRKLLTICIQYSPTLHCVYNIIYTLTVFSI